MKRVWVFIGIILLEGGVLFEEKHRAETVKQHPHPAAWTDPDPAGIAEVIQSRNFSDQVDLWGDPRMKTDVPDFSYAYLAFGNDPKPASVEKFKSRLDSKTEPVLTVQERQVGYSLLDFRGFKLNVNLKPAYSTPEALMPTRIDPGISGSFNF